VRDADAALVPPEQALDRVVEKVEFRLHPTFQPSKITVRKAPFELQRIGWGVFEIGIKVHFLPALNLPVVEDEVMLSFNRRDTFKTVSWKFDLRLLQQLPHDAPAQGGEPDEETEIQRRARGLQDVMLNMGRRQ